MKPLRTAECGMTSMGKPNTGCSVERSWQRAVRVLAALVIAVFLSGLTCSAPPARESDLPSENATKIKKLISRLRYVDEDHSFNIAVKLAQFKKEAMPFLIEGLESPDANTRKWCARAMTNIVGGFEDYSGRPDAESGGLPLLRALSSEHDRSAAWFMIQAIGLVQPDPKKAVPVLLKALEREETTVKQAVSDALGQYGAKASAGKPALIALVLGETDQSLRNDAVRALKAIGIGRDDALKLSTARFSVSSDARLDCGIALRLLPLLLEYPDAAMAFLQAHPNLLEYGGDYWVADDLLRILEDRSPSQDRLRDFLLKRRDLPSLVIAQLGNPESLPVIEDRIERADAHKRTFLEACARALGKQPTRIVQISENQAGDFKPKSACPNTDEDRWADGGGHGDGLTTVLITGRLLMPDGSPAVEPRFFNVNDRMLMGERGKDPADIKYDPKTGRFVFVTEVFAAYATGEGQKEPGPYQTGPAQVLIEAAGAKPLEVSFYDEMPDVEITLSKADGRLPAKGASAPPQETKREGNGPAMPQPVSPLDGL